MTSAIWAGTNTRPVAIKQNAHKAVYLYGAVNPINGDKIGLLYESVNTESMNQFLLMISKKMSRWKHCILVVDGAGWHRSDDLKVPKNITLLPLPPYSPELNPIERLWSWMKSNYLSHKIFKDIDALFDAGMMAWQYVTKEIVQSVCATSLIKGMN